jgi:hypothetical protein
MCMAAHLADIPERQLLTGIKSGCARCLRPQYTFSDLTSDVTLRSREAMMRALKTASELYKIRGCRQFAKQAHP